MTNSHLVLASTAYAPFVFGLIGIVIGGAIAGTVSLHVARASLDAADRAWMRDSRGELYGQYLGRAQALLIACEASRDSGEPRNPDPSVEDAYLNFFQVYSTIQTVAGRAVVHAARVQGYRLLELRRLLYHRGFLRQEDLDQVAGLVRLSRHATVDAMRKELGLPDTAEPAEGFNPFADTDLEAEYQKRLGDQGERRDGPPPGAGPVA